jgi:hypothetical protein
MAIVVSKIVSVVVSKFKLDVVAVNVNEIWATTTRQVATVTPSLPPVSDGSWIDRRARGGRAERLYRFESEWE